MTVYHNYLIMLVSLKYKLLQGRAVFQCISSHALWHIVGSQGDE